MGVGKDIFEGAFKFAASEARKKFDSTASAVQREEDRSTSPSTQEHQKLEGKLKHRVKRSMIRLGSDRRVIREQIQTPNIGGRIWKRSALSEKSLAIYEK